MENEKDQARELRINVVFEGGGAKGIAYVGALRALEQRPNVCIAAVAGASAGAITAMLVAAKYTGDELVHRLPEALGHLGEQIPDDVSGLWPIIKRRHVIKSIVQRLRETGAALDTTKLRKWLAERLSAKLGVKDGTLVTFAQAYEKTSIELYIVAANVSEARLMVFHHLITPDCQVVDAVLASSAIPGALPPGKLAMDESKRPVEPKRLHTLVDGGVWANFPDFVFKDDSFRDYWALGPAGGKVVGFLLHETDKSIETLSPEDYPRKTDGDEKHRSESSARFEKARHRTEAVLSEERTDPQEYGVWGQIALYAGCALLLSTCVGPATWAPLRDLRLLVPLELVSLGLLILALLVLPPSTQAMRTNEHGWPRNRITTVANVVLGVLSSWQAMLGVWVVILLGLGFAIYTYPEVSVTMWFVGWLLVIFFAMLLLGNFVALGSVAVLRKALGDWGWGVARTFLVSSGAPQWRGRAAGDWIVYLPIPKEVSTLSFAVHKEKLPESESLLLDRVLEVAEDAADAQLKSIFPTPKTTTDNPRG